MHEMRKSTVFRLKYRFEIVKLLLLFQDLEKFKDAWERCGKDAEKKFTWDLARNDNKSFGGGFKPRCRFTAGFNYNFL